VKKLADILFDLESKIRQSLSRNQKLGVEDTGKSIGEIQQEAKKPEPEKIVPPKQQIPTPQPPQKIYVEGSPLQRTIGKLGMVENQ
jgi:hypothetical protein